MNKFAYQIEDYFDIPLMLENFWMEKYFFIIKPCKDKFNVT